MILFGSLKELLRLLLFAGWWEKRVNPVRDHSASLLKLLGIAIGWCVELNTVATVVTVRDTSNLIQCRVTFHLRSPLPRIFRAVGEENVGCCNVYATLIDSSLFCLRVIGHASSETTSAHSVPEVRLKVGWSHDVLLAWDLEPAILWAVLEGPWASRALSIDFRVRNNSCIVVRRSNSNLGSPWIHHSHDLVLGRSFDCIELVTQRSSMSVLDTFQEDVGIVEHPVVCAHAFRSCSIESLINDCVSLATIASLSLLSHVGHRILDHLWAEVTTFDRRKVCLFIELPEVDNRLNNTRGGPRSSG